ncbi:hypothetical protein [Yersinia enterocolitica]|uniref:hypothetical protein n=1 Tax=Yersinia enterocolitica TaxID=630 RepID=UPI0005E59180|nr:hypothetical protein [Yersinia enterocolitica]CNK81452.1 Uncharacterised protein [Yersinia enterocolitica]
MLRGRVSAAVHTTREASKSKLPQWVMSVWCGVLSLPTESVFAKAPLKLLSGALPMLSDTPLMPPAISYFGRSVGIIGGENELVGG